MAHLDRYTSGDISGVLDENFRIGGPRKNVDQNLYNHNIFWVKESIMQSIMQSAKDSGKTLTVWDAKRAIMDEIKGTKGLNRTDVVKMASWVVTLPREVPRDSKACHTFLNATVEFLQERYGKENILYANLHRDEPTAQPHIHVGIRPALWNEKKQEMRFNAKKMFNLKDLKTFHPDLNRFLDRKLGYHISILLDPEAKVSKTKEKGNRTISQLKLDTEMERTRQQIDEAQQRTRAADEAALAARDAQLVAETDRKALEAERARMQAEQEEARRAAEEAIRRAQEAQRAAEAEKKALAADRAAVRAEQEESRRAIEETQKAVEEKENQVNQWLEGVKRAMARRIQRPLSEEEREAQDYVRGLYVKFLVEPHDPLSAEEQESLRKRFKAMRSTIMAVQRYIGEQVDGFLMNPEEQRPYIRTLKTLQTTRQRLYERLKAAGKSMERGMSR